jgi:hypothetical protein
VIYIATHVRPLGIIPVDAKRVGRVYRIARNSRVQVSEQRKMRVQASRKRPSFEDRAREMRQRLLGGVV